LMRCQMMRVISSPSISTTGLVTLIFAIGDLWERQRAEAAPQERAGDDGRSLSAARPAGVAIALAQQR
jgi:hypothetical protein